MTYALQTRNLVKKFGGFVATDNVTLLALRVAG